jgi:hypothetical protein
MDGFKIGIRQGFRGVRTRRGIHRVGVRFRSRILKA